ncbi:flavin reductase [Caulobacter sp. Root655]|uniref:flavin reductase family protein n=1 Tax=Caulobacter sp. Root655 TaxID=1736578 RepID=UPI0006FB5205|nr:flavin reductase family protein [Caulobacter sp. Root655]KRA56240.1 flavin reductase [Caulobacter sp. Root655]
MAFDADPRWLGDAIWPAGSEPVDASSGAEPPYAVHAPPVDPGTFKDALARLASGVAIISCWDGPHEKRTPRGLLVSSITGLSVDPPRFLFCVRKEASSHDALLAAGACGVAILSARDEDEALRFASPARAAERFTDPRWDLALSDAPRLWGGLTSAVCVIDAAIDAGGHTIVLVTARQWGTRPGDPLVAFDRGLRTVARP